MFSAQEEEYYGANDEANNYGNANNDTSDGASTKAAFAGTVGTGHASRTYSRVCCLSRSSRWSDYDRSYAATASD